MDGWPVAGGTGGAAGIGTGFGAGSPGGPAASAQPRADHLRLVAARIGQCADDSERILAGLHQVELMNWESPAGRACRDSLGRQHHALWLAGPQIRAAQAAVTRHAAAVADQESRGGVPWWI